MSKSKDNNFSSYIENNGPSPWKTISLVFFLAVVSGCFSCPLFRPHCPPLGCYAICCQASIWLFFVWGQSLTLLCVPVEGVQWERSGPDIHWGNRELFSVFNVPTKGSTRKTRLWTCFFHVIEKKVLFIDCVCKPLHFFKDFCSLIYMWNMPQNCFLIFENVSVEDVLHTENELNCISQSYDIKTIL